MFFLPSLPFLLISLLHIFGEVIDSRTIRHISKPFLIPLLALFYFNSAPSVSPLLVAALAGGWLGDLFLMVPDRGEQKTWFKLGLVFFLLGHIFYVGAFFMKGRLSGLPLIGVVLAAGFLLFGLIVFLKMKDFMGKLFIPVTLYISVIALMGASTTLCFSTQATRAVTLAVSGALIFMISDTMNAWNRFVEEIPHERVLTMTTYLAGQFLLILGFVQFAG